MPVSWSKHRFAQRDGMRHCLEVGCSAAFELTTGTSSLKRHIVNKHKEAAIALGFLPAVPVIPLAAVLVGAAAASASAAAVQSHENEAVGSSSLHLHLPSLLLTLSPPLTLSQQRL
jgi:hypothetical protein